MGKSNKAKEVIPVNSNAQQEVKDLLNYLKSIEGNKIILGQHTQTMEQAELKYIEEVTGELPALCGFELLGYSPNINYKESDEECLTEVYEAQKTLDKAWEWAEKKGIITFTWHWFSPLGGKHKSFYAEHTDFDPVKAAIEGTPENQALIADIDYMAGLLMPFCHAHIPILWRPFHECDGKWFWWGRSGADAVKKLYRIMYERLTYRYQLNNLIWVFNAVETEFYPGDDVVDIISCDMYPDPHNHLDCNDWLEKLKKMTSSDKIYAIGEIGTIPEVEAILKNKLDWVYYMTWSNDFGRTEKFTTKDKLKTTYDNLDTVTLSRLEELY